MKYIKVKPSNLQQDDVKIETIIPLEKILLITRHIESDSEYFEIHITSKENQWGKILLFKTEDPIDFQKIAELAPDRYDGKA